MLFFSLAFVFIGSVSGDEPPSEKPSTKQKSVQISSGENGYRTPLAGNPLRTIVLGYPVDIPERDRGSQLAVSLGSVIFSPKVGDQRWIPFGAIYSREFNEDRRFRGTFSGLYNEFDHAERSEGFQLLGHWENYTIPFPTGEVVEGTEIESTRINWGELSGWLGVGYRIPIEPFEIDNDVRLGVYYHGGALYTKLVHDTGPGTTLPPDTYVHGLHGRLRVDAIQRNIMELPHEGWALGADVHFARRDRWSDYTFTTGLVSKDDTRDYLKLMAYVVGVYPVPGLSERHRFLFSAHTGWADKNNLDRFSGFRIGGGPIPTESDDLSRHPVGGASFNQFVADFFFMTSLEYRFELFFFMFLHFRGTWAFGKVAVLDPILGTINKETDDGWSTTAAVTSGFLWDSNIRFEFSVDARVLSEGEKRAKTFLIMWSKAIW